MLILGTTPACTIKHVIYCQCCSGTILRSTTPTLEPNSRSRLGRRGRRAGMVGSEIALAVMSAKASTKTVQRFDSPHLLSAEIHVLSAEIVVRGVETVVRGVSLFKHAVRWSQQTHTSLGSTSRTARERLRVGLLCNDKRSGRTGKYFRQRTWHPL